MTISIFPLFRPFWQPSGTRTTELCLLWNTCSLLFWTVLCPLCWVYWCLQDPNLISLSGKQKWKRRLDTKKSLLSLLLIQSLSGRGCISACLLQASQSSSILAWSRGNSTAWKEHVVGHVLRFQLQTSTERWLWLPVINEVPSPSELWKGWGCTSWGARHREALGSISHVKQVQVAYLCNPNPWLYVEFEDSQGYMRPCLKANCRKKT